MHCIKKVIITLALRNIPSEHFGTYSLELKEHFSLQTFFSVDYSIYVLLFPVSILVAQLCAAQLLFELHVYFLILQIFIMVYILFLGNGRHHNENLETEIK